MTNGFHFMTYKFHLMTEPTTGSGSISGRNRPCLNEYSFSIMADELSEML
jgi:hypothetical protein